MQASATPTSPNDMAGLVARLAAAKSRQNVDDALTTLHPDMRLETPGIGSKVVGRAENAQALKRFFASFPDYQVSIDRQVAAGDTMVCWGTAHMTMTGDRFGVQPNGCRVKLPVIIEFGFADGLICKEVFNYDLSELCAQSGVSTDAVRKKLFGAPWSGSAT